jgi:protein-S-isoprenylcysteine O-methyltransferase Ste14
MERLMQTKHPLLKSLIIASVFTVLVVFLIPLLLVCAFSAPLSFEVGLPAAIAVALFVLGAGVSLACVKEFVFEGGGTPAPFDPPKVLVVRGFYKYVRNPMYLGLFGVILAEVLFFRSPALFLYWLSLVLFFNAFVIFYEEPKLIRTFGDSYRNYCKHVNRWMPSIHTRKNQF